MRTTIWSQVVDTTTLKPVSLSTIKPKNTFNSTTPAQSLSRQTLQQLNAPSAGDAVKYFSGVLVRDYGGVGGLKTVSIRSLGASNTGVMYDGVPVSDQQTGQIDLSRFSTTFLQSLDMQQAHPERILQPARAYSSAAVISMQTMLFNPGWPIKKKFYGGMTMGSFGLWQPSLGLILPVSKRTVISGNAELISSKGNYPYVIENGNLSEESERQNSKVSSLQAELNLTTLFADSSILQVKAWGYHSKRGLPGAVIFFNDRSVQQLWNDDYFLQSRYKRSIAKNTELLLTGKFNYNYTRYTDPDFLNNSGGLDSRYRQYEYYGSAAIHHRSKIGIDFSYSSDISYTELSANTNNFAYPSRVSLWNNLGAEYNHSLFRINAYALWTHIDDQTKTGPQAEPIDRFTPTVAISFRPTESSPFMIRAFYKEVFRMPTFNDLYYNFIGNSNLKPELTRQYDLGLVFTRKTKGWISDINLSADAYYNSISDKIIAIPNQNLFVWTMTNLGTVSIKGIDLTSELSGRFSRQVKWFTRIAYTYQHAINITNPDASNYKDRIPYTPDHSGSGLFSMEFGHWSAGYSILFSGTRYTLGDNNPANEINGWGTQDIFISRQLFSQSLGFRIKLEMNNLTNETYEVIRYYPMPGRSYKLTLSINSN